MLVYSAGDVEYKHSIDTAKQQIWNNGRNRKLHKGMHYATDDKIYWKYKNNLNTWHQKE